MSPDLWGLNPIVFCADIHERKPGCGTLFDNRCKGQLAMRDYVLESVAIAGIHVGVPHGEVFTMSTAQLAEAKKALIARKPLLRTYRQTIGDLINLFATGEHDPEPGMTRRIGHSLCKGLRPGTPCAPLPRRQRPAMHLYPFPCRSCSCCSS